MLKRSLIHYRSTAKSVACATVFFASVITSASFSTASAAESETMTLAQRVQHLEELNKTRNQMQAEISYQLSEIQREVRTLTGQVEENTFKLKQIQDRQRDLYRDIESRLSGMASKKPAESNIPAKTTTPAVNSNNNAVTNTNDRTASKDFEAAFA